jgi:hypothetical protein
MPTSEHHKLTIDTEHFSVLDLVPPFVNICLRSAAISPRDVAKIAQLAADYQNDARLIEMVRKAGDASAKVPYLLSGGETQVSILSALRDVAQPHVERLHGLPEPLQATICLLLSINAVPQGCEAYGIAALLEIDRMQGEMVQTLRGLMPGRKPAHDFYHDNVAALRQLDEDWPRLRAEKSSRWQLHSLPEHPQMKYHPFFTEDRLASVHETCVIVDSPGAHLLRQFTPAVLQRPLPAEEPVPATGSADWLIREVGKVGRHFTRALLRIIKAHLQAEQVALEAAGHELINQHAQTALREFVEKTP